MKTTNIVLIGVVGVGAVGAYLYMKNKKAQDNLLSGSLPATTPSGTPSTGTPTLATTPFIPTPKLTEKVDVINDSNLDAFNLQATLGKLKDLENELKAQPKKVSFSSGDKKGYDTWLNWWTSIGNPKVYERRRQPFIDRLASLGYKYDKGLLVKI